MIDPLGCLISFILALCLSLIIYKFGLLTKSGCVSAFAIGFLIGALGSVWWLALLIVFALLGFAATVMGLSKKREKGLQEGTHGERSYKNILGVAVPPLIVAILNQVYPGHEWAFSVAYIATIAVAAADTAASEIGVKDPRVWLITTFKRVEPGTDGGISLKGTLISAAASLIVSVIGYLFITHTVDAWVLVPSVCGIIGCMADSYVGATIETWGWVDKYMNNAMTGLLGGVLASLVCIIWA